MSDSNDLLAVAREGIQDFLRQSYEEGRLAEKIYENARSAVFPSVRSWIEDPDIDRLSPNLKDGLRDAIRDGRWEDIVNAHLRFVNFGTGGIRQVMGFDREAILRAAEPGGIDARILKGPNTINNVTILRCATGVARYLTASGTPEPSAVVGFDSRIQGMAFARCITEVLLAQGLRVYLFDEAVPYPEVTFAIPVLEADVGMFISASHNDYRYNGFKLSGPNGSQIPPAVRDRILGEFILGTEPKDIRPVSLAESGPDLLERLVFLGGDEPLDSYDYLGLEDTLVDMHSLHTEHVKGFILKHDELRGAAQRLGVVYSAFNGSGRRAVPRILRELGFGRIHSISSLDQLNGLFPAFKSDPGEEQQPDPGDPRAASIALAEFEKDVASGKAPFTWEDAHILIGTDPDADRCGIVVRPPAAMSAVFDRAPETLRYGPDHVLIPADDLWSIVLWYRFEHEIARHGVIQDAPKKFVALSHTTSDMIAQLAKAYGLGVLKTWVGFGWLSAGVERVWRGATLPVFREGRERPDQRQSDRLFYDTSELGAGRSINVATMEQSNGFSILGGPPPGFPDEDRKLGVGGHVRDKDGTLAALLMAEIAAYALDRGTDLLSILADEIYADERVGVFANYYEPDPIDGEYRGIEGDSKKKRVLEKAVGLGEAAARGGLSLGGLEVEDVIVYWTGKYDAINWPEFPDEGIRFYFGRPFDHLTIRPSGTSNALRFHVQLTGPPSRGETAWGHRFDLEKRARAVVDEVRERIGATRQEGVEF